MIKEYTSLGFMSGTSGDGVDASIISSDGNTKYEVIKDQFFEYESARLLIRVYSDQKQCKFLEKPTQILREYLLEDNQPCRTLKEMNQLTQSINIEKSFGRPIFHKSHPHL